MHFFLFNSYTFSFFFFFFILLHCLGPPIQYWMQVEIGVILGKSLQCISHKYFNTCRTYSNAPFFIPGIGYISLLFYSHVWSCQRNIDLNSVFKEIILGFIDFYSLIKIIPYLFCASFTLNSCDSCYKLFKASIFSLFIL